MTNVTALRRPASKNAGSDDKRFAAAFRSLEPDICDMVRAAEMASLAEEHGEKLLTFAIEQCLRTVYGAGPAECSPRATSSTYR